MSAEPELDRVQALIDSGRHDAARRLLAPYLAARPDDARALCQLAACHEADGDHAWMLEAAERACAAEPENEFGHRLRAVALLCLDRNTEAVAAARTAVELVPDAWPGHLVLAGALAGMPGRRRAALAAASTAVRLGPDEAAVHFGHGVLLHAFGRTGRARRAYRRTLSLDPTHAGALENLGRIAERQSRIGASVRYFSAAAALSPGGVAGTAHLRRVLRQVLGLSWVAMLGVMFVLVWAWSPVAWGVAAALLVGAGVWAWRSLRVLSPGLRRQAAGWLWSDRRLRAVTCSIAALLVTGLALGVAAATLAGGRSGPFVGETMLVLLAVGLAVMTGNVVVVKVIEHRIGRSIDEDRAATGDPVGGTDGWQLFTIFRMYWASGLAAVVVLPGTDAAPDRVTRAVLGVATLAGYGAYHWWVRRRPRRPLRPGWQRCARFTGLVLAGWLVNLACVVGISALPDSWSTQLALLALPPLVLVPVAVVIQCARLLTRLAGRTA